MAKKLLGLFITVAMVLSLGNVFADGETVSVGKELAKIMCTDYDSCGTTDESGKLGERALSNGTSVQINSARNEWAAYNVAAENAGYYEMYLAAYADGNRSAQVTVNDDVTVNSKEESYKDPAGEYNSTEHKIGFVKLGAGENIIKITTSTWFNAHYFTLKYVGESAPYKEYTASADMPVTVEAEHYDIGGEGAAYHSISTSQNTNIMRTDEYVSIASLTGAVGVTMHTGDWVNYTIYAAQSGTYKLEISAVKPNGYVKPVIYVNGVKELDAELPGDKQVNDYAPRTAEQGYIPLTAGYNVIKFENPNGSGHYYADSFTLTKLEENAAYKNHTLIDEAIENFKVYGRDYDMGGEGIAYHSVRTSPSANYRKNEYIAIPMLANYPISLTTDEWTEYTVLNANENGGAYKLLANGISWQSTDGTTVPKVNVYVNGTKYISEGEFTNCTERNTYNFTDNELGTIKLESGTNIIKIEKTNAETLYFSSFSLEKAKADSVEISFDGVNYICTCETADETSSAVLILAVYDENGKLLDIKFTNTEKKITLEQKYVDPGVVVKAFLWNELPGNTLLVTESKTNAELG